jgi:4a-hydroxytetrahydrobiopterin dehydratase
MAPIFTVMKSHLSKKNCADLGENNPRLNGKDIVELKKELNEDWHVVDGRQLKRDFKFPDFTQALAFTNRVGEIAEGQNHHPDIHLTYGRVGVEFSTHSAGGLTESDFILAAKVDELK